MSHQKTPSAMSHQKTPSGPAVPVNWRVDRRTLLFGIALTATGSSSVQGEFPVEVAFRGVMPAGGSPIRLKSLRPGTEAAVVTALAADPKGRLLAVACDDFSIRVIDLNSMAALETLQGHRDVIRSLSFDPAGDRLASAGNDGQILVWSRTDWLTDPGRHSVGPAIACARFSPDGAQIAAAGFDRSVSIVTVQDDFRDGLECGCRDLRAIAYRPDHQMLIVAGRSGAIHLFDPASGRAIGQRVLHRGRIRQIEFRPDGRTLVSIGEDGRVLLFDTERQETVAELKITSGRLFALAIVDERHIAVAGSDNLIRIVDAEATRVIHTFDGHLGSVAALASSEGWLYSGGFDATLRRWPVEPLQSLQQRIAEGDPRLDR